MNDQVLCERFESCALSADEWHHREHLRLAYLYLLRYPYDQALAQMQAGLKALNAAQGVPETLQRGYHETLTCGWMRIVYCTLCEYGPAENSEAFLEMHSHLQTRRALLFFYSKERLSSAEAKARFVEPDLASLPHSGKSAFLA